MSIFVNGYIIQHLITYYCNQVGYLLGPIYNQFYQMSRLGPPVHCSTHYTVTHHIRGVGTWYTGPTALERGTIFYSLAPSS